MVRRQQRGLRTPRPPQAQADLGIFAVGFVLGGGWDSTTPLLAGLVLGFDLLAVLTWVVCFVLAVISDVQDLVPAL